jgi:stage V sporulation protein R
VRNETNVLQPFPAELEEARQEIEQIARSLGLDFFETIFEMVDYDQINQIAAYGGFPQRYPHWRFGMEYEQLNKTAQYGLAEDLRDGDQQRSLLRLPAERSNALSIRRSVMAHVYGHCDFFKNNVWFSKTNRKMMDGMANHATRIRRYIERHGYERSSSSSTSACRSRT